MINICFYLAGFVQGGTARSVSIIGNELQKNPEYNVTALCHSSQGKKDIYKTDFKITYLYEKRISVGKAILKDNYIKKVSKYVKDNNINILIVCDELFYPPAIIAGRKIKVLCWLHTSPFVKSDYRFQKTVKNFGFTFSDGIIVLSKKTEKIVRKSFKNKPIYQIYNPLDDALFYQDVNYKPDTKKIISVGRLSYPKNFDRVVSLPCNIKQRFPELQWHIYGEGEERKHLEELIAKANLKKTVIRMGQHSDIYSCYGDYSVIVNTSRYEGFPMTLIEAASCGLPMISFDIQTGPSEIIMDGQNGYLCENNNETQMTERIIELLSDRNSRISMSEKSRKTALEYKLATIIAKWNNMFRDYL